MSGFAEYDRYDALGLAELVRSKAVTAEELLTEAILRIERVNPELNAIAAQCFEQAVAGARSGLPDGPFTGVPYLIKDLGPRLAGVPMTSGSRYFAHYIPTEDSPFIAQLKRSGVSIVAKTTCPEFGLLPVTEPALFGACRNPWNTARTPGGSSGGSAALVAAGVVPAAHGNDMGGSLRIPASCTGLFGFKPTRARMATVGGVVGDMNVDHAITRTVRDSAALLDAVRIDSTALYQAAPFDGTFLGQVERDPRPLRIAYVESAMFGKTIDPQCRDAARSAAKRCEELGHRVESVEPSGVDYAVLAFSVLMIFASNVAWALNANNPLRGTRIRSGDLEPASRAMLVISEVLSSDDLTDAVTRQRAVAERMREFMQSYDVILTPTLAAPPVPIGALALTAIERAQVEVLTRLRAATLIRRAAEQIAASLLDWTPFTPLFNLTGQPAMSVPWSTSTDGLPIGVQFAAALGDDATLFRLAGQLERAQPWRDRRPPVWSGTVA
jgi:Asp-tRNA(Asn)/Glu-tRNA(Gln) amidotransferase A subunit family amidase